MHANHWGPLAPSRLTPAPGATTPMRLNMPHPSPFNYGRKIQTETTTNGRGYSADEEAHRLALGDHGRRQAAEL
jgi:hypothetical protein